MFVILLAIMIAAFIMVSWGKSTGYAISSDEENIGAKSLLYSISPFFLGVMVVVIIWALLWLVGDWIGE